MTEDRRSGLDALDEGPRPSDAPSAGEAPVAADRGAHPTVAALFQRFGDAVRHHEVASGDQHVVHVDPARNVEILGWLDRRRQRRNRRVRIRGEQLREHDRVAGRLENLRPVGPESLQTREQPLGSAPYVAGVRWVVGYGWDGEKVPEFDEKLITVLA